MKIPFKGKCVCGEVSFICHGQPLAMYNCHCHGCQKMNGAPYAPLLVISLDKITFAGRPKTFKSRVRDDAHPRRAYCAECGAALYAGSDVTPDLILINALSLDEPESFLPIADIWTVHVLPWTQMDLHIPKVLKTPPLLGKECV